MRLDHKVMMYSSTSNKFASILCPARNFIPYAKANWNWHFFSCGIMFLWKPIRNTIFVSKIAISTLLVEFEKGVFQSVYFIYNEKVCMTHFTCRYPRPQAGEARRCEESKFENSVLVGAHTSATSTRFPFSSSF